MSQEVESSTANDSDANLSSDDSVGDRKTSRGKNSSKDLYYGSYIASVCQAMNDEADRSISPTEIAKLEKRRETNRMSARRCRKRRRDEIQQLEDELRRLSQEGDDLVAEKDRLRAELQFEIQKVRGSVPGQDPPTSPPPLPTVAPPPQQQQQQQQLSQGQLSQLMLSQLLGGSVMHQNPATLTDSFTRSIPLAQSTPPGVNAGTLDFLLNLQTNLGSGDASLGPTVTGSFNPSLTANSLQAFLEKGNGFPLPTIQPAAPPPPPGSHVDLAASVNPMFSQPSGVGAATMPWSLTNNSLAVGGLGSLTEYLAPGAKTNINLALQLAELQKSAATKQN